MRIKTANFVTATGDPPSVTIVVKTQKGNAGTFLAILSLRAGANALCTFKPQRFTLNVDRILRLGLEIVTTSTQIRGFATFLIKRLPVNAFAKMLTRIANGVHGTMLIFSARRLVDTADDTSGELRFDANTENGTESSLTCHLFGSAWNHVAFLL